MSENLKLKKVNKSFVPEPKKSSSVSRVFGFLYAYKHCQRFMHVNIFGRVFMLQEIIIFTLLFKAGIEEIAPCCHNIIGPDTFWTKNLSNKLTKIII